jgi:putative redox protein
VRLQLHQIDGLALAGLTDTGHWVTMDGPERFGGHSAGPRPMELMLMSLASCTGMDVVSILRKMRVQLDDFRIEVEADQSAEHPKVFTSVKLRYLFFGVEIRLEDIERAIELSQEKYCAVTAMLRDKVDISYEYKLVESRV